MKKLINRGKIIKKCVGEGLQDLGFSYKGYKGDVWEFERLEGKLAWRVGINIYRFDPWQVAFHLETNVHCEKGSMVMSQEIEGTDSDGDMPGYWRYTDEESMKTALEKIVKVVHEKGVDILKERSIPVEIEEDNEMLNTLYLHHEELAQAFIERTGIQSTGYDEENIKRWFDYIDPRLEEMREGEYDEAAKRELIEVMAFLGEQVIEYKNGWWTNYENDGMANVYIEYKKGRYNSVCPVVTLVMGKYLGNSREWIEEMFFDVLKD